MKNILKQTILATALFMLAAPTFAQGQGHEGGLRGRPDDWGNLGGPARNFEGDSACLTTALDAKHAAMIAAREVDQAEFAAIRETAYQAIRAALSLEGQERADAIATARANAHEQMKASHEARRAAMQARRAEFRASLEACRN